MYEKKEQLYEGKAKKVYATNNPDVLIVSYKDDATAFNGLKKGTISGKGVINNRMSNMLMAMLEKKGVPTHLVEELSERETAVKKVSIVPLEVIVRNIAAGSFSKRFGVEEGRKLSCPTLEFCLKNDDLGDPMIDRTHILALDLAKQRFAIANLTSPRGVGGGRRAVAVRASGRARAWGRQEGRPGAWGRGDTGGETGARRTVGARWRAADQQSRKRAE